VHHRFAAKTLTGTGQRGANLRSESKGAKPESSLVLSVQRRIRLLG